jgi:protein-S-isoprenylcysteine O-methyltransferase Ste14
VVVGTRDALFSRTDGDHLQGFSQKRRKTHLDCKSTIRNPIYVGAVLILIGEAVALASVVLVVYAVLMWWVFHFIVVLYEEPTLREKFGAAYEEYCRMVPRWIPHRRRGTGMG